MNHTPKLYESKEYEIRKHNLRCFVNDLRTALENPKSLEDVVNWINNITDKLVNFIKRRKESGYTSENFQRNIFQDICFLINSLSPHFGVRKLHNSFPTLSHQEYRNKSLGEQFVHNAYKETWNFDQECEGWNCTYWTISLYQLFDRLRKAWLDIKIRIYRLKDMYEDYAWVLSLRHSWLIIKFEGVDYILDYEWLNMIYGWCMVQALENLKLETEALHKRKFDIFDELEINDWNLGYSRTDNTSKTLHFQNLEFFLQDVKKYPWPYRVIFVSPISFYWENPRVEFEFLPWGLKLLVDGKEQMFILKDDVTLDPNSEDIFQEILDKLDIVVTSVSDAQSSEILKRNVFFKNTINIEGEEYRGREITDYDKKELLKYWNLIKDKVDVKKLAQVCQWEKSINKNWE